MSSTPTLLHLLSCLSIHFSSAFTYNLQFPSWEVPLYLYCYFSISIPNFSSYLFSIRVITYPFYCIFWHLGTGSGYRTWTQFISISNHLTTRNFQLIIMSMSLCCKYLGYHNNRTLKFFKTFNFSFPFGVCDGYYVAYKLIIFSCILFIFIEMILCVMFALKSMSICIKIILRDL